MVIDAGGRLVASHSAQKQANRCGSSVGCRFGSSRSVASDSHHVYLCDVRMQGVVHTAVEAPDVAPGRSGLYVHERHSGNTQALHAPHAAEGSQRDDLATL